VKSSTGLLQAGQMSTMSPKQECANTETHTQSTNHNQGDAHSTIWLPTNVQWHEMPPTKKHCPSHIAYFSLKSFKTRFEKNIPASIISRTYGPIGIFVTMVSIHHVQGVYNSWKSPPILLMLREKFITCSVIFVHSGVQLLSAKTENVGSAWVDRITVFTRISGVIKPAQ